MLTKYARPRCLGAVAALAALAACASDPTPTPTTTRSTMENKQTVRRLFEDCINPDALGLLDELIAPDYRAADGTAGPTGFAATITGLRSAFPDIHYTIEDLVAEADRVVIRWSWSGTHRAAFRGVPPSQKAITNTGIGIFELRDRKIVRGWLETDRLGFLQQIGAVPATPPATRDVKVLDSHMTYREAGVGPAVVFLHGNPTSSHLWRKVLPHVADRARVFAPDLIGMGASGKPDIPYRFVDHARYLGAWFDALDLRDVVLVGHDWGGALAMDWAARHPDRVRGIVLLETFLRPLRWDEWPREAGELFRGLRTPGIGERMVYDDDFFPGRALHHGVDSGLSDADLAAYRAPYPDRAAKRPLLQWPREIPIDGEPADVVARVVAYDAWLADSPRVPKLLLSFEGSILLGSPPLIEWARDHAAALEVEALGPAGHHAPEDLPDAIGSAIRRWLDRHRL